MDMKKSMGIPAAEMKAEDMQKATIIIRVGDNETVFEDMETAMVLSCNRLDDEHIEMRTATNGPVGVKTLLHFFEAMHRIVGDKMWSEANLPNCLREMGALTAGDDEDGEEGQEDE